MRNSQRHRLIFGRFHVLLEEDAVEVHGDDQQPRRAAALRPQAAEFHANEVVAGGRNFEFVEFPGVRPAPLFGTMSARTLSASPVFVNSLQEVPN